MLVWVFQAGPWLARTFGQYLGRFLFRDAFDRLECLLRRIRNRLDCVVPAIYEQLYVSLGEACNSLHIALARANGPKVVTGAYFERVERSWCAGTSSEALFVARLGWIFFCTHVDLMLRVQWMVKRAGEVAIATGNLAGLG